MNDMTVMWAGVFALAGWFWIYLFCRQLIFNFTVAYPLIKKMQETDGDLIADSSKKYTTTSTIVMIIIMAVIALAVVFFFRQAYMIISFAVGAIVCLVMLLGKIKPSDRHFFDSFCTTYYRFIPDDALRTAMYNCKPSQMKLRLHDMDLSTAFIPSFKEEGKD